ncbi:bifunctional ornithine acetyltransferase/N-acetylglutamate synthase [Pseudobutyrivibrio xylanivorans]|uniref:Arginine biosynthesis bifunctional protein ArgJ n=1 Tax=Pseudobutyrivibrio xylanivorans TaxID=185007 RepID=A0A5P6VS24_PSEXY|nr:bifunctional ornithine acetyltransferase/N-acetylglutamate synthase [Pseudobutyrivibrio xylanivorans]QFJ55437.1 bifunctional ornithine acetyltransferase/N-acetylglutamate synthase [Pseudobutyrivibrio xylanivorans]
MKEIKGGITAAKGFKVASTAAGIKYQGRTDMAMVYSEVPCVSAGTFTSNVVKAACVQWDMNIVNTDKSIQAVVINSGIANACTGKEGFDACEATAKGVEKALGVSFENVAVASTGVIGMQLPVDKLVAGVEAMAPLLDGSIEAGTEASKAIMTTDTVNKEIAAQFQVGGVTATLGGMSKGSGMIHPNMCTMLAFLGTDLAIEKKLLQKAVSEVVADTFNMITVDGDTSTNDTLLCMANGLAGNEIISAENQDYEAFKEALSFVCESLAKRMAADGEGASKLFEANIVNAKSKEDAKILARAIVGSNLSKAAIFGCDANFGRFLCAMGYSGADFDQNDVELYFKSAKGQLKVFDKGTPLEFDEDKALEIMKADAVTIFVNMNEGTAEATAWGCDLTYDYVKINADYRS